MSLRLESTLAEYERAAVDPETWMWEVSQTSTARARYRIGVLGRPAWPWNRL